MNLKDNVNFIKEEISTEEKFVENFFKFEQIWKKYKKVVIALGVIAVVAFIGSKINDYISLQTTIKANNAFNVLIEKPNDTQAIATLKESNPKLLEIANYLNGQKENKTTSIDIEYLKELAAYNTALEKNDLNALNNLDLNANFLLKEYAIFQKALTQTVNKDYKNAKQTLKSIPQNSPVSQLAAKLQHFLLSK